MVGINRLKFSKKDYANVAVMITNKSVITKLEIKITFEIVL